MSTITGSSHSDADTRSLQVLLEIFGSRFSLDDIAAAYCQANQNVDVAGEILLTKKTTQSNEDKTKGTISKLSSANVPKEPRQEDSKAKVWRPKKCSASIGTVSSVIGKEYISTKPLTNPPRERTKPVKIDSKDIPETELWSTEMPESNKGNISRVPTDVEEFIVKMLGEGFQASEDVIHDVLGICGYDVKKSTEKLLVLSDTKKYDDGGISTEVMLKDDPQRQGSTPGNQVELQGSSQSDAGTTLPVSQEKDKAGQERKILEALFSGVERNEKETKVTRRVRERRVGVAGRPVVKPLEDPCQERVVDVKRLSHTSNKEDENEENEFKAQRKAVQEHWNAMKEYYGAAAEAFWKGETERAHRLMEKGHFFGQKAREADEKSIAKMIDVKEDTDSTCKEEEILTLNVHDQEPREALRLLKGQLTYFSGISSFKYLRVELSDSKEDTKSKRLIAKLLERESITWSEEDNGLVMMIRVDEIDPKSLSFAKK